MIGDVIKALGLIFNEEEEGEILRAEASLRLEKTYQSIIRANFWYVGEKRCSWNTNRINMRQIGNNRLIQ